MLNDKVQRIEQYYGGRGCSYVRSRTECNRMNQSFRFHNLSLLVFYSYKGSEKNIWT
jgi:hypothetical protein